MDYFMGIPLSGWFGGTPILGNLHMIMTVVVTVSSFVIHINHDTSNDDIITIIREKILYVENHLAGSNPNGKIPVVLTNHEKMVIKKCFLFFFWMSLGHNNDLEDNVAWAKDLVTHVMIEQGTFVQRGSEDCSRTAMVEIGKAYECHDYKL